MLPKVADVVVSAENRDVSVRARNRNGTLSRALHYHWQLLMLKLRSAQILNEYIVAAGLQRPQGEAD